MKMLDKTNWQDAVQAALARLSASKPDSMVTTRMEDGGLPPGLQVWVRGAKGEQHYVLFLPLDTELRTIFMEPGWELTWERVDVPEEDVPQEDVPQEDVPQEDVRQEDVPQEEEPEDQPERWCVRYRTMGYKAFVNELALRLAQSDEDWPLDGDQNLEIEL